MPSPLVLWLTLAGALLVVTIALLAVTGFNAWIVVGALLVTAIAVAIGMRATRSR